MKTGNYQIIDNMEQGSAEWLALRKTKITATDASAILGVNPWKTKFQLYNEKISDAPPAPPNERMQRGIDLEPVARDLFWLQTGEAVKPAIIVKDWAMASLDGLSDDGAIVLEIKCPGEKDHSIALSGAVPEHYYPQLQHQIYVSGVNEMFYYSFDGFDGVAVIVRRDQEYIDRMVEEEKKFYEMLMSRTPPEPDYTIRSDDFWIDTSNQLRLIRNTIDMLQKQEQELRDLLINSCNDRNCKGAGVSVSNIYRKGNVDYSKIPQLSGVDLELYRKAGSSSWRVSFE